MEMEEREMKEIDPLKAPEEEVHPVIKRLLRENEEVFQTLLNCRQKERLIIKL